MICADHLTGNRRQHHDSSRPPRNHPANGLFGTEKGRFCGHFANDLKRRFSAGAEDIARGVGIGRSAAGVNAGAPAVLALAPPPLGRLSNYAETFEGDDGRPARIATFLKQITAEARSEFLNIGEYAAVSDIDGVHFDAEGHDRLARAVAARIQQMPVWNSPELKGC